MDPKFIQIMNDHVWFIFILSRPPVAILVVLIATASFRDHNLPTIYPRRAARCKLRCAVLITPAGLIEFVETGPFADDGAISFRFIDIVFFGPITVMSCAERHWALRMLLPGTTRRPRQSTDENRDIE